jgi:hypothetical protein
LYIVRKVAVYEEPSNNYHVHYPEVRSYVD